jgi:hypothetical protein
MPGVFVTLDDYVDKLPVSMPAIHRKKLSRIRGLVMTVERKTINLRPDLQLLVNLVHLEDVVKPFSLSSKWIAPEPGMVIECIATESSAWFFVKWWARVHLSQYKLRSENEIEDIVLELLAGSPDDRITSDDLHIPEIYTIMKNRNRDPRVLGAVLAGLGKMGVIKAVGTIRSRRKTCHNRPGLVVWSWAIEPRETGISK